VINIFGQSPGSVFEDKKIRLKNFLTKLKWMKKYLKNAENNIGYIFPKTFLSILI